MEAMIRRVWDANPNCVMVYNAHQAVTDYTNNDSIFEDPLPGQGAVDNALAIMAHYGIPVVDDVPTIQALVTGGAALSDYYADNIHPTVAGQQVIANLLYPYLPYGGGTKPDPMPDYLHAETPLYENEPVRRDGVDYNAKTGTWSEVGGTLTSSTEGSTVTYIATCQSWGTYRDGSVQNVIELSVDGGGWTSVNVDHNGRNLVTRAEHTIIIRVPTGQTVRIDEFWAI